jgi:hypothetical protein
MNTFGNWPIKIFGEGIVNQEVQKELRIADCGLWIADFYITDFRFGI